MTERALIGRLAARLPVRPGVALGIGDDAAVLDDDPATVVTSDVLVEGVHFRRRPSGWRDVGHRALAVNLSDLAAMGARPLAAVVGLVLPTDPPLAADEVDELYEGMEGLAARHGLTVAGGDVSVGPALVLAVTALGRMAPGVAPRRRAGARPGDLLCVTGAVGAAAAGLLLLEEPARGRALADATADALRAAHLRPEPRLAAGARLAEEGVHALMDCSDGVALDGERMAEASGLRLTLSLDDLPIAEGVPEVAAAAATAADELAATGGEDFELLAAVAPADLARARAAAGVALTPIGVFGRGAPGLRITRGGTTVELPRLGWLHDV